MHILTHSESRFIMAWYPHRAFCVSVMIGSFFGLETIMNKKHIFLLQTSLCILFVLVLAAAQNTNSTEFIPISGQSFIQDPSITLPSFEAFVNAVKNGDANIVRGVYVPGIFALRVQQQPQNNVSYVPSSAGIVAQFRMAAQSGTTGLIAHNYLSGALFFELEIGQEIIIVYGDGSEQHYIVRDLQQYQALDPNSIYSDFLNLDTNEKLSATDLFNHVYTGAHHLTFQTCIAKEANLTWGRLFVIAVPLET